jgi:hypothetical protein
VGYNETSKAYRVYIPKKMKTIVSKGVKFEEDFPSRKSSLYYIIVETYLLILVLYVDILFLTGAKQLIIGCKVDMAAEFEMKDICMMHYLLGLEVWQRPGEIFLKQGKYAVQILKRFQMEDCKPMATPMITNLKKVTSYNFKFIIGGYHVV